MFGLSVLHSQNLLQDGVKTPIEDHGERARPTRLVELTRKALVDRGHLFSKLTQHTADKRSDMYGEHSPREAARDGLTPPDIAPTGDALRSAITAMTDHRCQCDVAFVKRYSR